MLNVHGLPNPSPGMTVPGVPSIQQMLQSTVGTCPGKKRGQLLSMPSCLDTGRVIVCSEEHSSETPYRLTHHLSFALLIARFPVLFLRGQFSPSFNNTARFIIPAQKKDTAQTKAGRISGKDHADNVDLKYKLGRRMLKMGVFTFRSFEDMLQKTKPKREASLANPHPQLLISCLPSGRWPYCLWPSSSLTFQLRVSLD